VNIGVIGSGNIGGTLAECWAEAGHEVALSNTRGPESLQAFVDRIGSRARAVTVDDAAAFGDVVLAAIPFGKYETLPASALAGKIVIDAMNYFPARDGEIEFGDLGSSELVARHLSDSRVIKAFNTLPAQRLAKEGSSSASLEDRLVVWVAGDDAEAKAVVDGLVRDIGFAPLDTGSLHDGGKRQQPGQSLFIGVTLAEARKLL
jgi:8-hydroxy-5-deazaflavin:NADPH oxidoreductase